MTDADFRTLLQDRLGPALDELSAPDLLAGVRSRQVQHRSWVRAGLALASATGVTAVVVAVAVWPQSPSAGPTAPAATVSASALPTPLVPAVPSSKVSAIAAPASAVPSPSTAIVNLTGLAPLVSSGPCAGLTVGAFVESRDIHPVITAITSGVTMTMGGGGILDLRAAGPCIDRLSFVQRTPTFQDSLDVPLAFFDGEGAVVSIKSPRNVIGALQLFLDCKGLDCGSSGAPLSTIRVKINGSGPGAASLPFAALQSPLPLPTGDVVVVPSVVGLTVDAAKKLLIGQRFGFGCDCFPGTVDTRVVTAQDPVAGSTVPRTGASVSLIAAGLAPRPTLPPAPTGAVAPPSSAVAAGPSLPPPTSVAMPSVVGLTVAKAEAVLKRAGVIYLITYRYHPEAAGSVMFQYPKPGALVRPGTKVRLTVSLGPVPKQ